MTRREAVRVKLFARATVIGVDRSVRCAVVNLSAAGAMLSLTVGVPMPPLRLRVEFAGETLEFPVEVLRVSPAAGVAVAFQHPHSESLHHLIAVEQRHALAQGRVNISERRLPPAFGARPDESAQPPKTPGA
jgi:hypothetical protein